jgi:hypothetical protein
MNKCLRFSTALVLMVMAGGMAAADEIRGVIAKADTAKKELVVELRGRSGRDQSMTFQLSRDTRIQVGRQAGEPSDLRSGARVRIRYQTHEGQRVASEVIARGGKRTPATAHSPENTISGTIHRIIFTEREIIVVGPGRGGEKQAETTVLVPESARIMKDGKPLKLDDLREGDPVVVRADKLDGKLAAVSVEVKAPVDMVQRIEQIRQALRVADFVLQQIANMRKQ